MGNTVPEIRNTAKAICYNGAGAILMLKKAYEDGTIFFTLPGGSQEPGESLEEALIRECEEEIGTAVIPGKLQYIHEYIKHSRTPGKNPRHKVEFGFSCTLPDRYVPQMGYNPDPHQTEVLWLPSKQLLTASFIPARLPQCLEAGKASPLYLGLE